MATPSPQPAAAARHLTKVYLRHFHDARSLKEILMFRSHRGEREPLVALRDVSFEVQPGEMLGVVGMNGAGKSSLLKLLAGITPPTEGEVEVHGRIGSLLELGAGFQPDLSGMENIFLNASVMGIPREEVEESLDSIIEFAGLRRFIHTPVKHYSTGMYVRLGFSAAVHMRPELLLIDEVLSVGDSEFQVRSFQRLFELRERGVAGVLVSHDLHTVEALCDRLLWIEHGEMQALDATSNVLRAYRRHLQGDVDLPALRETTIEAINLMPEGRIGTGEVTISSVRILGADDRPTQTLIPGQPVNLAIECVAREPVEDADIVLTMENEGLKPTMIRGSDHGFSPTFGPGRHLIRVHFDECLLTLGSYRLSVALMKRDDIYRFYDHHIRLHSFAVHSPLPTSLEPLLRIPATFDVTSLDQPSVSASRPSTAQ